MDQVVVVVAREQVEPLRAPARDADAIRVDRRLRVGEAVEADRGERHAVVRHVDRGAVDRHVRRDLVGVRRGARAAGLLVELGALVVLDPALEQHDVVGVVDRVTGLEVLGLDDVGDVLLERREAEGRAAGRGQAPRPRHEARAVRAIRVPLLVVLALAVRRARAVVVALVVGRLAVVELRVDPVLAAIEDRGDLDVAVLAGRHAGVGAGPVAAVADLAAGDRDEGNKGGSCEGAHDGVRVVQAVAQFADL